MVPLASAHWWSCPCLFTSAETQYHYAFWQPVTSGNDVAVLHPRMEQFHRCILDEGTVGQVCCNIYRNFYFTEIDHPNPQKERYD